MFKFLDQVTQQVVIQTGQDYGRHSYVCVEIYCSDAEDGEDPDKEPITNLDISKVITTYLAQEEVDFDMACNYFCADFNFCRSMRQRKSATRPFSRKKTTRRGVRPQMRSCAT